MPLFGGPKRPKLDGLLREEERRRDALNPAVLERAGEKGVAGQAPAAVVVLRERAAAEPASALWPLLLGWQQVSLGRYDLAVEAFLETIARDADEVRAYYGVGNAYFYAAEDPRLSEGGWSQSGPLASKTVDNLYHESLRHFRRALELTEDRSERDRLAKSISGVEKALARKAGRL